MDTICIFLQLILTFYSFYSMQLSGNVPWGIIGLLTVHLIIYLLNHLVKKQLIKTILYSVNLILLVCAAWLMNSSFWILVIALNAEFVSLHGNRKRLFTHVIFLGAVLAAAPDVFKEQLVLYVIILLGLMVLAAYEEKVKNLKHVNEDLREKLYRSNKKIEYVQKEASQIEAAAKVQERNLLVQKLHDKIGHTLAANIMQLEAVKILLHSNKDGALNMLEQIIENLRTGMDDIRHTLRNMKPEQSELGINQIKGILEELKSSHSIETELLFEGDISVIGLNIWHIIAQNLRETITNLLKYSKADRLIVKIEVFNKIIKVQFKDNGEPIKGYKKGLGLMGIEERTQSINGRLVINTENGFDTLMIINREDL